jgi:hypothetical protein
MIVAKAVVPNQYWILRKDNKKIGNIEAGPDGFQVRINNTLQVYKTISNIAQREHIAFENINLPETPDTDQVNGFHTTGKAYNAVYDIKHQVPLWTKESRSKSWYAAGWYRVKQGRKWYAVECPKLILLDRYEYQGPFKTKNEASK